VSRTACKLTGVGAIAAYRSNSPLDIDESGHFEHKACFSYQLMFPVITGGGPNREIWTLWSSLFLMVVLLSVDCFCFSTRHDKKRFCWTHADFIGRHPEKHARLRILSINLLPLVTRIVADRQVNFGIGHWRHTTVILKVLFKLV
jgi:hypothetical protein